MSGAPTGTAPCGAVRFAASMGRHAFTYMASTSAGRRDEEEGVPFQGHGGTRARRADAGSCENVWSRRRRHHHAWARRSGGN
jgi:hypothetical protein